MKRTIMKRLAAALHQPAYSRWQVANCLLRLPPARAATAPLWSPGRGYLEVVTAQVWAATSDRITARATVVTYDPDTDGEVLAEAEVAVEDVLGLGGLCDKPHRIRSTAQPGSLRTTPLAGDHPVLRYRAWCDHVSEQIEDLLDGYWRRCELSGHSVRLSRIPGEGFRTTVGMLIDPDPYW